MSSTNSQESLPSDTKFWKRFGRFWHLLATLLVAIILIIIAIYISIKSGLNSTNPVASIAYSLLLSLASVVIGYICASLAISGMKKYEHAEFLAENVTRPIIANLTMAINESHRISTEGDNKNEEMMAFLTDQFDNIKAELSLRESPSIIKDIDWEELIENSTEIDFMVQGWDGWMRDYRRAITDFLIRGGKFRLYIIDPESAEAEPIRALMAIRLGRNPHKTVVEIKDTKDELESIYDEVLVSHANIVKPEIHLIQDVNWYFGARFVGSKTQESRVRDVIIFSIYSHKNHTVKEMPVIKVYPDKNPVVASWFMTELKHISKN